MRTNLAIAALIYPMIQAVAFGIGLLPLVAFDAPIALYPYMIAATFLVSAPIALAIAPLMRSRAWRRRHGVRVVPS